MHKIPHSDVDLLKLIAQGDQHAYQLIFEKYWDSIYNTALLLTKSPAFAEDIAQDVFAMLWEKRTTLPTIEKAQSFLFVTARNIIYSRFRKLASDKAYRQYIQHCFQEQQDTSAHEQAEYRELEQTILRTIHNLSPQQQKAFRLSRFQGMQHKEIAQNMGLSPLTIKSYIVQAIVTLRRALANHPSRSLIILWTLSFFL
ncbi:RNA polymerase sigma-70 factor [Chitinophaga sp.]|uniref:RNA polymerase sigma factor n=1 Tax=Chitinophaga sp. TaxID=1869181 RepID=UPI0031D16DF5